MEGTLLQPGPPPARGTPPAPAAPHRLKVHRPGAGRGAITPGNRSTAASAAARRRSGRGAQLRSPPGRRPSVAIATYDPKTGQFATPDGTVARQADVAAGGDKRTWTDLIPTGWSDSTDFRLGTSSRIVVGQPTCTSLKGMVMILAMRPQAPLGPVVASSPTRVFDDGSV